MSMYRRIEDRLYHAGWNRLGAGVNAAVYGNPNFNFVVKLSNSPGDSWLDYILAAAKLGLLHTNPFFPRVHRLHLFKGGYVAVMERLDYTIGDLRETNDPRVYKANELRRQIQGCDTQPTSNNKYERELVRFMKHNFDYVNDMHNGNIMVRGDQVVIIDPVHNAEGSAVKYRQQVTRKQKRFKMAA